MKYVKTHIGSYETEEGTKYQVHLNGYNKTHSTLEEAELDLHNRIIDMKVKDHEYPYDFVSLLFGDDIPSIEWINEHFDKNLKYVMQTLTEREQEVITLRDIEGYTLEAVAERYHITKERVRQIEAKAIRKIRSSYRMKTLQRGQELSAWEAEIKDLSEKLIAKKDEMIRQLNNPETIEILPEDLYANTKLWKLDLSVRSYNCLDRAGFKTLADFIDVKIEDLMKVRNLGRKSLKEIVFKLQEWGIFVKGYETVFPKEG